MSLTSKLLDLVKCVENGVTNDQIEKLFKGVDAAKKINAINAVIRSGQVDVFKQNGTLVYKFKKPLDNEISVNLKTVEEKIIYDMIEKSGNKGIWTLEIRKQSNLKEPQINRILKNLEMCKLIKPVKCVNANRKKVYMLYDTEPDVSISGGVWYQDHEFESEFVEILNKQCLRFLIMKRNAANDDMTKPPQIVLKNSYATINEVHKYISDLKISRIPLTLENIDTILYTVVLDGKAERIIESNGTHLYIAVYSELSKHTAAANPCTLCTQFSDCCVNTAINPPKCVYLTQWLHDQ